MSSERSRAIQLVILTPQGLVASISAPLRIFTSPYPRRGRRRALRCGGRGQTEVLNQKNSENLSLALSLDKERGTEE